MDQENTKNVISFLMDASDVIEKAKQEVRGMIVSGRSLSCEEHEAITELVKGMASDIDILDDYNARYEYILWLRQFAPNGEKFAPVK
jgi:hypothetical protein